MHNLTRLCRGWQKTVADRKGNSFKIAGAQKRASSAIPFSRLKAALLTLNLSHPRGTIQMVNKLMELGLQSPNLPTLLRASLARRPVGWNGLQQLTPFRRQSI
jgi:hypothetical protein